MKKIRASFCLIFIILFACSPKKNTWTSRAYQGFAVKYNVGFNAVNSFNEAQNALILANTDDYSDVLPLYPTVNKETTSSISSQLNTTIEKCRKAIKLHSIRSKPTSKPMGMSDKEFRAYREQEEFNPQIPKAWLGAFVLVHIYMVYKEKLRILQSRFCRSNSHFQLYTPTLSRKP